MNALVVASSERSVVDGRYYPRWNGLPRVVGCNALSELSYFAHPIFLNALKQAGGNTGYVPWMTMNSSGHDSGEEAYLTVDSDFNVTSLVAGNGFTGTQQFVSAQTFVYLNIPDSIPPGATVAYTAGQYTLEFSGPGTFTIGGDFSSLSTSSSGVTISGGNTVTSTMSQTTTGTVTFTASGTGNGFFFTITALPSGPTSYLKFLVLVPTAYLSQYNSGEVLHPAYKAIFTGSGYKSFNAPLRFMGPQNINGHEYQLSFTANLPIGATSGTLSSVGVAGNSYPSWPFQTGTYDVVFQTGQVVGVNFVAGQTSANWSTALSSQITTSAVGAAAITAVAPAWSQRAKLSNFSWLTGLPYEAIVIVCNELGLDCWLNVPAISPTVDSTYLANLAALLRDGTGASVVGSNVLSFSGLSSSQKLFVEYSNETWNFGSGYRQANFCEMMSVALGYYAAQGSNGSNGGQEYYGTQVAAICDAFSAAYGQEFSKRVCVVCMNQFALGNGTSFMELSMNTPDAPTRAYSHGIGAYGFAPYAGPDSISSADAATVMGLADPSGEILGTVYSNKGPSGNTYSSLPSNGWGGNSISIAQQLIASFHGQPWAGLPVVCYEGGSSLDDAENLGATWRTALTNCQRDSRFAYFEYDPTGQLSPGNPGYFEAMRLIGISFICQESDVFASIASDGHPGGGGWGALESPMQAISPLSSAPSKYQGIMNFIASGVGT